MRAASLTWPIALASLFIYPAFALNSTSTTLNSTTMTAHLQAGASVLGTFQPPSSNRSNWMSTIDDDTHSKPASLIPGDRSVDRNPQIVQDMNIPGTHDSLTCMHRFPQDCGELTDEFSRDCRWHHEPFHQNPSKSLNI
jgi:hypothetical protein